MTVDKLRHRLSRCELDIGLIDDGNRAIGTINGEEINLVDQRQAATTLQILQEISPVLIQLAGGDPRQEINALQWYLIMHDAHAMGLSASELQIDQLLKTLGIEQDR